VILIVTLRSASTAAVAIAPLLGALSLVLGAMGMAGMPLGIATSMFSALAVGVGIDFALHFLHAYERERIEEVDHRAALSATLQSAGRAIRWNASVLAVGFAVLTSSALRPNHDLGLLLGGATLACYTATLLFLPAMLEWKQRGGRDGDAAIGIRWGRRWRVLRVVCHDHPGRDVASPARSMSDPPRTTTSAQGWL
jgi:predicted RND superfamily exporter protein